MSDQYASSDLTLNFSSSVMVEVCCIFMIMLLGNLLGYLLWNRHLDYLLLVIIYIRNLICKCLIIQHVASQIAAADAAREYGGVCFRH
jgi:hypothetical protein